MTSFLDEVLASSAGRTPVDRTRQWFGLACCCALTVFVIVTTAIGKYPNWIQYEMVLVLVLGALFALRPGPLYRWSPAADAGLALVLTLGAVLTGLYMMHEYFEISAFRQGLPNKWDLAVYTIGTLIVLEGARRAEGWILLSIVLAVIAYLFTGPYFPGFFGHRGLSAGEVVELAYSQNGIFGIALGSVVDIVYIYVIFGVALRITGAGEFFDWIAGLLTLGRRSGPAQCAIVASALFGSINGSSTANVVANGAITINMMNRAGFGRAYAGAVEASSSVVGQIMPPVMGVGAFIMAEITGIPYTNIMLAALVPAFLFLFSLSAVTALEAAKLGISPLTMAKDPWTGRRLAQMVTILSGFAVLLIMLFSGYSVDLCGLGAIATVFALAFVFPSLRPGGRKIMLFLVEGGREGLSVAAACAAIGIVIGAVGATGLGIKFGQFIIAVGQAHLLLALLAAAAAAILLGMGLPTAASYLTVIFIAGPAIVELGLPELAAHMFIFYFAVMSAITPPVALAVFAAAAIAQEPAMRVAKIAMRLCLVAFLFPFLWAYQPELLLQDVTLGSLPRIAFLLATLTLAVLMLSALQVGYFRGRMGRLERSALAVGAVLIYIPGVVTTTLGMVIGVMLLGRRLLRARHPAPSYISGQADERQATG